MVDRTPDDRTWSPGGIQNKADVPQAEPVDPAAKEEDASPAAESIESAASAVQPAPSKDIEKHTGPRILTGIKTFHRDSAVAKGEEEPGPFSFLPSHKKANEKNLQEEIEETLGTAPVEEELPQDENLIPDNALETEHKKLREDREVHQMTTAKEAAKGGGRVIEPSPHYAVPESVLEQKPKQSIVRTYEDDTADTLKEKKANVAKVMLAEKRKREERDKKEAGMRRRQRRQALMVKAGLSFLGVGIIAFLGVWAFQHGWIRFPEPKQNQVTEESLVLEVDSRQTLDISGLEGAALRTHVLETIANASPGMTYITFSASDSLGESEIIGERFLPLTGANIPPYLGRALEGEVALLVLKNGDRASTALLFPTSSRENAFAGMLSWEQNMARDLDFLFSDEGPIEALPIVETLATSTDTSTSTTTSAVATPTATSTFSSATSSEPIPALGNVQEVDASHVGFSDYLYQNRDVRVYTGFSRNIVFLYTFALPNLLVIARDSDTLAEIFQRLERQQ